MGSGVRALCQHLEERGRISLRSPVCNSWSTLIRPTRHLRVELNPQPEPGERAKKVQIRPGCISAPHVQPQRMRKDLTSESQTPPRGQGLLWRAWSRGPTTDSKARGPSTQDASRPKETRFHLARPPGSGGQESYGLGYVERQSRSCRRHARPLERRGSGKALVSTGPEARARPTCQPGESSMTPPTPRRAGKAYAYPGRLGPTSTILYPVRCRLRICCTIWAVEYHWRMTGAQRIWLGSPTDVSWRGTDGSRG